MVAITRIDRAAPELAQLVALGRPFIASDLLADSFVAPVDDRDHVLRTFGEAIAAQHGRPELTLAEYFAAPDVQRGSIAARISPALEARINELARRPPLSCREPASVVWIGRAGCKQRFHCDMDCSGIFLAQALGQKRVCLVSPRETQKLQPGLDRVMLLSEAPFHVSDRAEQARFLAFTDGYEATLGPGETLYIPPLWWHFVEYDTDCVALSMHAASVLDFAAGAAWDRLWKHEWPLWQGIVSALGSDAELRRAYTPRARALLDELAAPRGIDVAAELRALHDAVCPGRYVHALVPGDAAFLERRPRRPLPPLSRPWTDGDVPQLQPYLRFALAGPALIVLDNLRVVAELALDADTEAVGAIALAVQDAAPGTTIAALAGELECDAGDLCVALAELSSRGWISRAA